MPRALQACLILSGLSLVGCAREADTFRPRIIITQPEAGSISRQNSSTVRGYAVDDRGIQQLRVNGQPLAPSAGTGKISAFAFKTETTTDHAEYTIEATDTSGRTATVVLPLRYDPNPPKLSIEKLERDGTLLRITGVATDDVKVAEITVDGSRLGVGGSRSVPFYAEASGKSVEIVVTDGAGNQTVRRVD